MTHRSEQHCKGYRKQTDNEIKKHRKLTETCGLNQIESNPAKIRFQPTVSQLNLQNVQGIIQNHFTCKKQRKSQFALEKTISRCQNQYEKDAEIA